MMKSYDDKHPDPGPAELEVIVPCPRGGQAALEKLLWSISQHTERKHRITVGHFANVLRDDTSGALAAITSSYCREPSFVARVCGENEMVHRLLAAAIAPWVAVIPVGYEVHDPAWFGKLHMPHSKVSTCALSIAMPHSGRNTLQPFEWRDRAVSPDSRSFLLPKRYIPTLQKEIAFSPNGNDYLASLMREVRRYGLTSWACPSAQFASMV